MYPQENEDTLQGVPKKLPTFIKIAITRAIFSLEIQFRYFWEPEACSYLARQKYSKIDLPR